MMKEEKILRHQEKENFLETIQDNKKIALEYSYKKPVVPKGFKHIGRDWYNGFTIRNMADGSEFVWIPVGYLEADGTLDGENFNQRFGRRNFVGEEFSDSQFHENIDQELFDSIKKYEGFYISAYLASKENGKLVFKKGNMPWNEINQIEAKRVSEEYAKENSNIVTVLPSGAVYDSIFKWIIQTGTKTFNEVIYDSTTWGNYWNTKKSPQKVTANGSEDKWMVLGIYDLAGNCAEWTTEENNDFFVVMRGGFFDYNGTDWPAFERSFSVPDYEYEDTSFRTALYVK